MPSSQSDIISRLQSEILPLQGFKSPVGKLPVSIPLGPINTAFPNNRFPLGAVHEFICSSAEQLAVTTGFIAALFATLMKNGGVCLWISAARTVFPPALKHYGIDPASIIFIDLHNQKEVAWAVEEALKYDGLAAVVGELYDINFTTSRRLQLAVEKSQVTGFLLNRKKGNAGTNACLTRWQISALPSAPIDDLPGIGHPCWKVALLKVRNGRPGVWDITWMHSRFTALHNAPVLIPQLKQKTG